MGSQALAIKTTVTETHGCRGLLTLCVNNAWEKRKRPVVARGAVLPSNSEH